MAQMIRKRCAIYTRKSVDEGLDMEFNSLDAQRQACESYITSQEGIGWVCLPERYDDGGYSGGTMERPALKRLLEDAKKGLVDIIVIYKLDRLSRSIADFAELSKSFDEWGVSFCSITQELNTSTSSGRMMVNILMTFAQFEREVIAERIRDKMSASRKRGQWVGGNIPFGYIIENRHLVPNPETSKYVPEIFEYYSQCGSAKEVCHWLNNRGIPSATGKPWKPSYIYTLLSNHTYLGEVFYKGEVYKGEQQALLKRPLWDKAQELLQDNSPVKRGEKRERRMAPLRGILRCGHCGGAMVPAYTKNHGKQYMYYLCVADTKRDISTCPVKRLPAGDIEKAIIEQLGVLFRSPTFVTQVASILQDDVGSVMEALENVESFWEDLFPVERNRLMKLLIDHVDVYETGLELKIKTSGMRGLIKEITNVQD